ncbi:uncharacterized protein LOC129756174 [Uranotaenia lowii]|uniref:uncharacterized protein LOC129756174 n=1 Tax=Uranotaenia lowii TaxID=190385 RepID=UPI00247A1460|nr:uncharacterized protein LOC129756174 [Uranotaenia lowii]
MEIDTGSAVSVVGKNCYNKLFSNVQILKCDRKLVVVNGSRLNIFGEMNVWVEINGIRKTARLVVLETGNNFTPLIGRDWMDLFYPNWRRSFEDVQAIRKVSVTESVENILNNLKIRFAKVFNKDFSEPISGYEADLTVKDSQPIFKRPYEVPYKIRDKLLEHLELLEKQKISLGGHLLSAHRNQLKLLPNKRRSSLVLMPYTNRKRRRNSLDDEKDFPGFPDVPHVPQDDVREAKTRKLCMVNRSPIVTRRRNKNKT